MNETTALTDSRLAALCAEAARDAFVEYEMQFDEITRRGRARFLARDWRGSFDDTRERLRLYPLILDSLTNRIRQLVGARLEERSIWSATKAAYSALIAQSPRWEIAESFLSPFFATFSPRLRMKPGFRDPSQQILRRPLPLPPDRPHSRRRRLLMNLPVNH